MSGTQQSGSKVKWIVDYFQGLLEKQPKLAFSKAMEITKKQFMVEFQEKVKKVSEQDTNNQAPSVEDSWRSSWGNAFERVARIGITHRCKDIPRVAVFSGKEFHDKAVWNQPDILSEPIWARTELRPYLFQSNVDVVIARIKPNIPKDQAKISDIESIVAVCSVNWSVRERYQQDIFWAERFRFRHIPFCLITGDKGLVNYACGDDEPKSENSSKLSKDIAGCRAIYDRVYLFTTKSVKRDNRLFAKLDKIQTNVIQWLKWL